MNTRTMQLLPTLEDGDRVLDHMIRTHLEKCEQNKVALLIAGGSAAGKTTLCRRLTARGTNWVHVTADNYYVGSTAMQSKGLKPYFFDDPRALDAGLAAKHVRDLVSGCPVKQPVYSFQESEPLRVDEKKVTQTIYPGRVILVDNLFAFYGSFDPWIAQDVPPGLLVARIYIEASPNVRFTRRYERDTSERGKHRIVTTLLWRQHVQPMYERYVRRQVTRAEFVIRNDHWLPRGYTVPLSPWALDCRGYTLEGLSVGRSG